MGLTIDYLAGQGAQALPIAGLDQCTSPTVTCHPGRTKINIIWSCLVTIFLCTWVAIHPNVPGPNATWLTTTLRRVQLMILTILAPEAIIIWACGSGLLRIN